MTWARLTDLGSHLASRTRARQLRVDLLREVGERPRRLTIDLDGVESVSDSFADELFGILARDQGVPFFREHVELANVSDIVRATIVRAIRRRVGQSEAAARGVDLADPPGYAEEAR